MKSYSRQEVLASIKRRLDSAKQFAAAPEDGLPAEEIARRARFETILADGTPLNTRSINEIVDFFDLSLRTSLTESGADAADMETAMKSFTPAGDLRQFLLRNCQMDHGEEVKVVLKMLLVYKEVLSRLERPEDKLDCLQKFPNNVERETYDACVQGVKERLESVLLNMNPTTTDEFLVRRAYDEVIGEYQAQYYKPGGQGYGRTIDVHSSTVIGWTAGAPDDGATHTTHLYQGYGNRALKLATYRNLQRDVALRTSTIAGESLGRLKSFFKTHPINDAGEECYYDSQGRKYRRIPGGNVYETEISGKKVRCSKDARGGYWYDETDEATGAISRKYLTAQINNGYKALEEKLKALSIISPSAELNMAELAEAGFLTDDYSNWRPVSEVLDAAKMHFFPTIIYPNPWQSFGDGEASIMSEKYGNILSNQEDKKDVARLIARSIRSSSPTEQAAAIHVIFTSYFQRDHRHDGSINSFETLAFRLGLGLLTPEEREDFILRGNGRIAEIAFQRASEFLLDRFAQIEVGVPEFMKKGLQESIRAMPAKLRISGFLPSESLLRAATPKERMSALAVELQTINDHEALRSILSIRPAAPGRIARFFGAAAPLTEEEIYQSQLNPYVDERINSCLNQGRGAGIEAVRARASQKQPSKTLLTSWLHINNYERTRGIAATKPDCLEFLITNEMFESLRFVLLETDKREEFLRFLNADANREFKNNFLRNALENGCTETVKDLITPANINQRINADGASYHPLQLATINQQVGLVNQLLSCEAGLAAEQIDQFRGVVNDSYMRAIELGNIELALRLIESPSIDHHLCFAAALHTKNLELARAILTKCDIDKKNSEGLTFLHVAAAQGSASTVRFLIDEKRLKVKDTTTLGHDALSLALRSGSAPTIDAVLQQDGLDFYSSIKRSIARGEAIYNIYNNEIILLLNALKANGLEVLQEKLFPILETSPQKAFLQAQYLEIFGDIEAQAKSFRDGDLVTNRGFRGEFIAKNAATFLHAALTKKDPTKPDPTPDMIHYIMHYVSLCEDGTNDYAKCTPILHSQFNRRTALHFAINQNCSGQTIDALLQLEYGANPNMRDQSGRSALFYAVENCNFVTARKLLALPGIEVDAQAHGGITPLYMAGLLRSEDMALDLLKKGANLITAFEIALERDHSVATFLLEIAVEKEFNLTMLFKSALVKNNTEVAGEILNKIPAEHRAGLLAATVPGTPFNAAHLALNQNNPNLLLVLLDNGADINSCDDNKESLLMGVLRKISSNKDFIPVALRLLDDERIVVSEPNSIGDTPLKIILTSGLEEISEAVAGFILTKPDVSCKKVLNSIVADTSLTAQQKTTAALTLISAIEENDARLLEIASRIILDTIDSSSKFPNSAAILDAVLNKMSEEQKISFFTEEHQGTIPAKSLPRPAIHHAAARYDVALLRVCVAHGALINTVDRGQRTPLLYAASYAQENVARYLVEEYSVAEEPVDFSALDNKGNSALKNAVKYYSLIQSPADPIPVAEILLQKDEVRDSIPRDYDAFLNSDDGSQVPLEIYNNILINKIPHGPKRNELIHSCFNSAIVNQKPELALPLLDATADTNTRNSMIEDACFHALSTDNKELCRKIIKRADADFRCTIGGILYKRIYDRESGLEDPDLQSAAEYALAVIIAEIDEIPFILAPDTPPAALAAPAAARLAGDPLARGGAGMQ